MIFASMGGGDAEVDFWWVKPLSPKQLESRTLHRNVNGPHKNRWNLLLRLWKGGMREREQGSVRRMRDGKWPRMEARSEESGRGCGFKGAMGCGKGHAFGGENGGRGSENMGRKLAVRWGRWRVVSWRA